MSQQIFVSILDDHQSIVDGYLFRLNPLQDINVVATASYAEELFPLLAKHPTDVLILDVMVPVSPDNPNPYPILYDIPRLFETYPDLAILVISAHSSRTFTRKVLQAGVNGYILKEDKPLIQKLGQVIRDIVQGNISLSQAVKDELQKSYPPEIRLTDRQTEIFSLLVADPDLTAKAVAIKLHIACSTTRNLMSDAYFRLGVQNRRAALAKVKELGLVTHPPPPEL